MRCKVGDLAVISGDGARHDPLGVRGLICEVVGPAQREGFDWSVRLFHLKPNHDIDTWAAMDCWLRPIRPGDMSDETPTEVIRKVTA